MAPAHPRQHTSFSPQCSRPAPPPRPGISEAPPSIPPLRSRDPDPAAWRRADATALHHRAAMPGRHRYRVRNGRFFTPIMYRAGRVAPCCARSSPAERGGLLPVRRFAISHTHMSSRSPSPAGPNPLARSQCRISSATRSHPLSSIMSCAISGTMIASLP